MTLLPIRAGEVGAVVTLLEMTERPSLPRAQEGPFRLEHWSAIDLDRYRVLFRRIGGPWLWYSRLRMNDAELSAAVAQVYSVIAPDGEIGMVELDFRVPGECLIRFLGVLPELAGRGLGRWLMAATLCKAWAPQVRRVHLSTCSLDHPAALPAYLKAGFLAYGRSFESFADPRLLGLLPKDAAPQVPLIGTRAGAADSIR